eukprot:TRINITY_DN16876_c1_g1_i2.p1 TRINITY_DN16876_c1_g1~~TRINITY_DN16876_c1_g1_i2.p1  ORF type:complete len:904 (+),score=193.60 TRINITY_DN16876_c1_g1_i2:193-2904(+)
MEEEGGGGREGGRGEEVAAATDVDVTEEDDVDTSDDAPQRVVPRKAAGGGGLEVLSVNFCRRAQKRLGRHLRAASQRYARSLTLPVDDGELVDLIPNETAPVDLAGIDEADAPTRVPSAASSSSSGASSSGSASSSALAFGARWAPSASSSAAAGLRAPRPMRPARRRLVILPRRRGLGDTRVPLYRGAETEILSSDGDSAADGSRAERRERASAGAAAAAAVDDDDDGVAGADVAVLGVGGTASASSSSAGPVASASAAADVSAGDVVFPDICAEDAAARAQLSLRRANRQLRARRRRQQPQASGEVDVDADDDDDIEVAPTLPTSAASSSSSAARMRADDDAGGGAGAAAAATVADAESLRSGASTSTALAAARPAPTLGAAASSSQLPAARPPIRTPAPGPTWAPSAAAAAAPPRSSSFAAAAAFTGSSSSSSSSAPAAAAAGGSRRPAWVIPDAAAASSPFLDEEVGEVETDSSGRPFLARWPPPPNAPRRPSPSVLQPQRQQQQEEDQRLAMLYVERVRPGMEPQHCGFCRRGFALGQLRLGYAPAGAATAVLPAPPRWVHASPCASRCGCSIRPNVDRVAFSHAVTLAERDRLLSELAGAGRLAARAAALSLRRGGGRDGQVPLRPWVYAPARVQLWAQVLVPDQPIPAPPPPPPPPVPPPILLRSGAPVVFADPRFVTHNDTGFVHLQRVLEQLLAGAAAGDVGAPAAMGGAGVVVPPPPQPPAERQLDPVVQTMLRAAPCERLTTRASEDCVVCREPMLPGEECRRLPCLHLFHKDCIDNWMAVKATCPLDNLRLADMLNMERDFLQAQDSGAPGGSSHGGGGGAGAPRVRRSRWGRSGSSSSSPARSRRRRSRSRSSRRRRAHGRRSRSGSRTLPQTRPSSLPVPGPGPQGHRL